jgi:LysM repeat protein
VAAVVLVVTHGPRTIGAQSKRAPAGHARVRRPPPYWTVRPGDTLTNIAHKTGLTVDQIETYNPNTDPQSLVPGERLLLWPHPPRPRPKPLGPLYWTVRPGESFGLIAAKTGINITTLEELNPQLKPSTLQPGNRVRLRH